LRAQIEKIEGRSRRARSVLPFGITEVDSRLPGGGLALGALHEIAGGGNGAVDGAAAASFSAGLAARTKGKILWCITRADLFAPAIAQAGLASDRVIYLEAGDDKTVLACMEEGLRHGGLGAVIGEVARLSMTASRRLQLAAEGIYRPQLAARFVLNRCAARTVLARETAETLADHDPPLLSTTIGQRIVFADVVQTGRLAAEQDEDCPGAREIEALAAEVARIGA
jgi:hypothetical protein